MSSNVYGYNTGADEVVDSIRAADADVVAIQELNLPVAEAIRQDLSIIYPYQALSPDTSVRGLGVISRYPLQPVMVDLEGDWVGEPQVLEMTWQGESITLVNFHAIPPGRIKPSNLNYTIAERERQLANLVQFVERQGGPVIALGDLNAAEQNAVYRMMRGVFRDAWAGGGWGFGHTYPGDPAYGSEGLQILGIWVPMWLLRLDYVFHSPEWQVDSAWIGPWSGVSDHRPVVARLVLRR
jgi:endonuclease/exonuclease/phosphatase (EEP) superfamily protein YafD